MWQLNSIDQPAGCSCRDGKITSADVPRMSSVDRETKLNLCSYCRSQWSSQPVVTYAATVLGTGMDGCCLTTTASLLTIKNGKRNFRQKFWNVVRPEIQANAKHVAIQAE